MKSESRRAFLKAAGTAGAMAALHPTASLEALAEGAESGGPPNILLVAVDDLNYDAIAWLGGRIPGLTPNIDRLANEGMRFTRAYNTHSRCAPSRGTMMTGLYQDRYCERPGTGNTVVKEGVVPLPAALKQGLNYRTAVLGKETHYRPVERYDWDVIHPMADMGVGRDPERYHRAADKFVKDALNAGQPFFLSANTHDPHRPFAGSDGELRSLKRRFASEIKGRTDDPQFHAPPAVDRYTAGDVVVPGFLPDLPDVRKELAWYLNSVYRCDVFVGRMLDVLVENDVERNTLVVFLSDNGMHFPFAKSNCYMTSVRTPLVFRWPGRITPGSVSESLVSTVDLMPTLLEFVGCQGPHEMDGVSLSKTLQGQKTGNRDHVFASINGMSRRPFEMRTIIGERYGYIYNHFADGSQQFYNGKYPGGISLKAMEAAADTDPAMRERLRFMYYRTLEEFYDLEKDPNALTNLVDSEAYKDHVQRFRKLLAETLEKNEDPFAGAFRDFLATAH